VIQHDPQAGDLSLIFTIVCISSTVGLALSIT